MERSSYITACSPLQQSSKGAGPHRLPLADGLPRHPQSRQCTAAAAAAFTTRALTSSKVALRRRLLRETSADLQRHERETGDVTLEGRFSNETRLSKP